MATVGNLFVNVGASTRGLESGLKRSEKSVRQFEKSAKGSLSGLKFEIPGIEGLSIELGAIIDKFEGMKKGIAGFGAAGRAAAEQQAKLTEAIKASEAASQALAGAKGSRKNIGEARAMLAKSGIDPNKAAAALKIEDTSAIRKNIATAIGKQTEAEKSLAGAQLFAQKVAKGRDPFTGQFLSAADKLKVAEKATKDLEKAQSTYTASVAATSKAHQALGAVQQSNRDKEAMRGKLNARGIDISKGQGALKLQDLSPMQKAAAAAKGEVSTLQGQIAESSKAFSVFGMSGGAAAGALVGVAAAAVAGSAALIAFAASQAKVMAALNTSALAAGINVESLQRLNATYMGLGAASGTAEASSQLLAMKLQAAYEGSEDAQGSFKQLGLDLSELSNMTPDAALEKTVAAISRLGSQGEKMSALKDIFGKSGTGLASVVNSSAAAFDEASKKAAKVVIPKGMVEDLARSSDNIELMGAAFGKLEAMLASTMAPILDKMSNALFDFMTADDSSLMASFEAIAGVVDFVYEILVKVVDMVRIQWNAACVIVEAVLVDISVLLGGILKGVEWIVYGFEAIAGQGHSASATIGEMSDTAFQFAKNMKAAAETDFADLRKAAGGLSGNTESAVKATEAAHQVAQEAANKKSISIKFAADAASLKKVDEELQSMRDKVANLKFGENAQQLDRIAKGSKNDPARMKEAAELQKTMAILEAKNGVQQQIAEAEKRYQEALQNDANTSAVILAYQKTGSMELAKQLADTLDRADAQERINTATKAGNDMIRDLQSQVDGIGKSEIETLRLKMEQQGIGEDLIKQALELQGILDSAKIDSSLKDHFTALNESLLKATGNERALIENQLKNIGLTGDALQNAVDKTVEINAKIDEANKQTANTETITSTIQDLADQLDALKLGEAGVLEKKLRSAGAGDAEVQKALAMQAEIAAINEAKTAGTDKKQQDIQGVVDSIDTAFGSFKMGGISNGEMVQKDILSESAKQTELLAVIAGKTTGAVMMAGMADQSGASLGSMPGTVGMSKTDTDLVSAVNQSNKYLADIATNTAGFAGVLT